MGTAQRAQEQTVPHVEIAMAVTAHIPPRPIPPRGAMEAVGVVPAVLAAENRVGLLQVHP